MTHVLTVAARDLRERAFVFVTAAVLAVMPFIVALVHGVDRRAVILIGGFIASVNLTIGVALTVGATMIGRDLSDRRLSFYFAKPIPATAIWFGKLLGAIVTVAAVFAIGFIPTYFAAGSAWQVVFSGPVAPLATGVLVGALCLIVMAHGISTIVRSHSPLIALDLVLFTAAIVVLWLIELPLLANFAFGVAMTVLEVAAFAVPLTLVFGGAWQLSRGRTDVRRSHRELSQFFWIAMAVVIAGLAMYDAWILAAGPKDLRNSYAISSPRGDWYFVTGTAKDRGDYEPTFLVNAANGKTIRPRATRWGGIQFTRRGDAAILLSSRVKGVAIEPLADVSVMPLDGSGRRIDVGATVRIVDPVVVVSDDLRRLAKFDARTVSVYDLASQRLLGSARVPYGDNARMFFVSPSVVRVYAMLPRSPEVRIYEFDAGTRQLQQTGTIGGGPYAIQVSADGSTAVFAGSIVDGRTGAVRATIERSVKRGFPATLLPNGWVAIVDRGAIRLFDSNGAPLREIPMPPSSQAMGGRVGPLIGGRKLLVSLRRSMGPAGSDLYVVDAQSGAVERVEQNVSLRTQTYANDPRIAETSGPEVIISDRMRTLWRWNPMTGAKTKV